MLYKGSEDIVLTRDELFLVPTPEPQGPRHRPVPFGEFATEVVNAIKGQDYEVVSEEYTVTNDGQRFFGLITVGTEVDNDAEVEIGIRGSHDRSVARGLVFGTRVVVCSNLSFHGDLGKWSTRQTTKVENRLPVLIDAAVAGIEPFARKIEERFSSWKRYFITKEEGDAVLAELFRRGGLTAAQLGTALREWVEPSFDHGDGWTVWRLYNAATESLKPTGRHYNNFLLEQRSRLIDSNFVKQYQTF